MYLNKSYLTAVAVAILSETSRASPFALPQTAAAKTGKYYGLGDSYASGVGAGADVPPPFYIESCYRTQGSYVWNVKNRFYTDDQLGFNACSGQKIGDVRQFQIPTTYDDATLVTVQAGGNDVGFYDIVTACIYDTRFDIECSDAIENSKNAINSPEFRDNASGMLDELQAAAPNALILFIGYLAFYNQDTPTTLDPFCHTDPQTRAIINDLVGQLNGVLSGVAGDHAVPYIDANPAFDGHRFCEGPGYDEWFQQYFSNSIIGLFHPTAEGHEAIAELISVAAVGV